MKGPDASADVVDSTEAADGVPRRYSNIFMRLRQAANHPFLLESLVGEALTIGDIESLREELADSTETTPMLDTMERFCVMTRKSGSTSQMPYSRESTLTTGSVADSQKSPGIPITEHDCPVCCKVPTDDAQRAQASSYCQDGSYKSPI